MTKVACDVWEVGVAMVSVQLFLICITVICMIAMLPEPVQMNL